MAPDTAKQAPTNAATILRGNLIFQMICDAVSVSSVAHNVSQISDSDTGVEPQISEIIMLAMTAITKIIITDIRNSFRSFRESTVTSPFTNTWYYQHPYYTYKPHNRYSKTRIASSMQRFGLLII